ncbi:phage tail protein [Pannus brasiliensis CCIBt3594]|uniref:Phage tail protein n=1 Tax=Pannus brasiliensis CCIBt3594 TaxID=1427578 RepID=A0AAW9QS58_9CHRO
MTTEFLIGGAISLGASAMSALFGSGRRETQRIGKQENFTVPRSSFGDYIPEVWGLGRVGGILIWAEFPPEERIRKSGGKGPSGSATENYNYFGNCAFLLGTKTTAIEEIYLNSKLAWKNGEISAAFAGASFRIVNGTNSQSVDSMLEVALGDRALTYRNRTILYIEGLPLKELGDAYPQCSAIERNGFPKLSEVIRDICLQSPRLTADDIDVSELTDIDVTGFQIDRETSIAEKLQALQKAYFFDLIDTGRKLRFQRQYRPSASLFIPDAHLAAREEGGERGRKYRETRADPTELPTRYIVKFLDVNRSLEANTAESLTFPTADNVRVETIDYPGALTYGEAKSIAHKALWLAWTRARTQEISLPPKYAALEPGDVIEFNMDSIRQKVQINSIEYGANHQILVRSWAYNPAIFDFASTADATYNETATATQGEAIDLQREITGSVTVSSGETVYELGTDYTVSGNQIIPVIGGAIANGTNLTIRYEAPEEPRDKPLATPSDTLLEILDIPRAYEDDFPVSSSGFSGGLYALADGGTNWRNASLFLSRDGGTTYDSAGTLETRSIFGTCETTFDGTSVDIRLPFHAELESISTELFNLGKNRALIGEEILDFQNASLQGESNGDRVYRLTGPFTRGLSGTPTIHAAGESFYLLSGYLLKLPGSASDIGKTLYFKALTTGQVLSDVSPVIITVVGRSTRNISEDFILDYEKIRAFL